jgi:hypothetical protein
MAISSVMKVSIMWFAVALQAAFAVLAVGISAFFGVSAVYSAMAGAAVVLVPNLLFAMYLALSAQPSTTRFFVGEAVKVGMVLLLSLLVWRDYGSQIEPVAFWVALIVVLKASGLALLRST